MSDCPKVSNAIKPRLEHGWEVRISSSHPEKVYYWNRFSGDSVWDFPEATPSSSSTSTLSSSPSSLSSKSSISKLSEAGSSKKPTSTTKSPQLFEPKSCPKITLVQKGIKENIKTITRTIKTHNIAASQTSKPIKTLTPTKEAKFDLKQRLSLFLNEKDISPEKIIETGKSPLLRSIAPSATISKASVPTQKSYNSKDPSDCYSDMEVETMTSDDEANLSDVEMKDISKEFMSDLINKKEKKVSNTFHIVIDTNVLLHNFELVKSLRDIYIRDCGRPILVIPWVILIELDAIKKKSDLDSLFHSARKAIKFISSMMKNKHPQINLRNDTEEDKDEFLRTQPSLNWAEYDDRILFCGLKLRKKIGDKNVCLLTGDQNLRNKSMAIGLNCCPPDDILDSLKTNFQGDIVPKDLPLTNADKMDKTMKSAFITLTKCLSPFLVEKIKEKYKDTWETIVYRKPPWVSLLDILENYSKHWMSVFSHLLPISCKTHLEKMKDIYQESKGYIYQTQESCRFLDASIYFLTECDKQFNIFQVPINRLKEIKQEVCDLCALGEGPDLQSQVKNMQSSFSPLKFRFEKSAIISTSDSHVLDNLHYLWLQVFTQYTCRMLDSLNFEHEIPYNKPADLPSKSEALDFVPKLYKLMQTVRTALRKFLYPRKDTTDEEIKGYLKTLHKQFSIIQSTLKIDIYLPFPHMDLEGLEAFFSNTDYRQVLNDAYSHFNNLFTKLHEAISTVSYDELS